MSGQEKEDEGLNRSPSSQVENVTIQADGLARRREPKQEFASCFNLRIRAVVTAVEKWHSDPEVIDTVSVRGDLDSEKWIEVYFTSLQILVDQGEETKQAGQFRQPLEFFTSSSYPSSKLPSRFTKHTVWYK